jgi:hypothetical protein
MAKQQTVMAQKTTPDWSLLLFCATVILGNTVRPAAVSAQEREVPPGAEEVPPGAEETPGKPSMPTGSSPSKPSKSSDGGGKNSDSEVPRLPDDIASDASDSPSGDEDSGRTIDFDWRAELTSWGNVDLNWKPGKTETVGGVGHLDLGASADIKSILYLTAGGRFRYTSDIHGEFRDYDAEPREVYAKLQGDFASLTVGQQVVRWGVTDFVSPNDVVNPKDFRDRDGASTDSLALPVLAARGLLSLNPVTLEGVLVPFFVGHKMPPALSRWGFFQNQPGLDRVVEFLNAEIGPQVGQQVDQVFDSVNAPSKRLENMSGGGRITYRYGGLDAGFNVFYGWDRFPMIKPDAGFLVVTSALTDPRFDMADRAALEPTLNFTRQNLAAGGQILNTEFRRTLKVGYDLAFVQNKLVFKFENSIANAETIYTTELDSVRLPTVTGAGGFDYRISDTMNFTFEAFGRYLLGGLPPGTQASFSTGEDFVTGGLYRYTTPKGALTFQLGGAYSILRRDYRILPRIEWQVVPSFSISVGALVLNGPANTFGGVHKDADHAFLMFRWRAL